MQTALIGLAAILTAVVLAPPLSDLCSRYFPVPLPVVEIVLGILIGPVLGIVAPGGAPATLGRMGIAALVYLAGYELDYKRMTRRQLGSASGGWLVTLGLSLAVGIGVAFGADAVGIDVGGSSGTSLVTTGMFIGIAMTSTALGSSMAALRDSGIIATPLGRAIVAAGAVGQFAPLLALSVVFGGRDIWYSAIALVLFTALVLAALRIASRGLPGWAKRLVTSTMHSSGHFAVRVVVWMVAVLAAFSVEAFSIDLLIGAFAAGTLVRQLMNGVDDEDRVLTERKVQALGFGFLTPIFFVHTGVAFDLHGLLGRPLALALVPVFLVMMLVVRGLPGSLVLPRRAAARDRVAAMLWTSVALAVVVAVVNIATEDGVLSTVVGAAMIGAAMVSMLAFPSLALAVRPLAEAERRAAAAPR